MILRQLLFAVWALVPIASASEIVVPRDHPDLGAALAAAAPGDVILVRTVADQAASTHPYTLVIDKPVTIIGEPVCNIGVDGSGPFGIELKGPGYGEVTLSRVAISYSFGDSSGAPTLRGGGFESVNVIDSSIDHDNCACSGMITASYPAIELSDVQRLTVVGSVLRGGPAGVDSYCIPASSYIDGSAAIAAPSTAVLLLDSHVEGGRGSYGLELTFELCTTAPAGWGGRGGDGVQAAELYSINTTVVGGLGTTWIYEPWTCKPSSPLAQRCGDMPAGRAFVVGGTLVNEPCSRLTQSTATPSIGSDLDFTWDPTQPACLPDLTGLGGSTGLLAVDLSAPKWATPLGSGWLFVDPQRATLTSAFPADQITTVTVAIPPMPNLVGLPYTAQVLVGASEVSGPATGRIAP
ncbi:MAG: hypothetical protein P1V81_04355 [Planctomycetota bacterium]|nr:hypothetical protein [Planctomycetota bacterium]